MLSELGTLYVVATPIGNLEDITLRGISILRSVDICAAEDTRNTKKLFSNKNISTKLISYHDHSSPKKIDKLIQFLTLGKSIALVSDAGTPCVSDPGYTLIKAALDFGIRVIPVPGVSSITAILSVAGLPADRFIFQGFVPRKGKKRTELLSDLKHNDLSSIFFESGLRIIKLLEDINFIDSTRSLVLGRELTKIHECLYRGTAEELIDLLSQDDYGQKGEFVLLVQGAEFIDGNTKDLNSEDLRVIEILSSRLSKKEALSLASEILRVKKNRLYKQLI